LPRRLRRLLLLVDRRAESGTESIVRVLLALVGIVAAPQVRVPFTDFDRLDLVVGDRLVIECDSRAHHSTAEQLDRDDARDLALTALGFLVLRVRYRTVMRDPEAVVAAVRRLVDAGLHLDRTAPSRRGTPS
jgi:very-short-patch-repair endonuclease